MLNLGMTELLVLFGIVVLLFGAKRLPGLGRALGEGIASFRKAGASPGAPSPPPRGGPQRPPQ